MSLNRLTQAFFALLCTLFVTLAACGGGSDSGSGAGRATAIDHIPFYVLDTGEPVTIPIDVVGLETTHRPTPTTRPADPARINTGQVHRLLTLSDQQPGAAAETPRVVSDPFAQTSLTATAAPATAVHIEIDDDHDLLTLTRLEAGLITITVEATVTHTSGSVRHLDPVTFDVDETSAPTTHLRLAVNWLNRVRSDPAGYEAEIKADLHKYNEGTIPLEPPDPPIDGIDLSDVEPRPPLKWHPILAQVAQAKCEDMRDRNYFSHPNPDGIGMNILMHQAGYTLPAKYVADPGLTYFESLSLMSSAPSRARLHKPILNLQHLIWDDGIPSLGHMHHLLGVGDFRRRHRDIGLGWIKDSLTLLCVLIAHQ